MAVAHKLHGQAADLIQCAAHERVFERPDDVVEIIFVRGSEIAVDEVVEYARVGIMAAKAVAGKQGFQLRDVRIHAVGPMKHGHTEEFHRQTAQVNLVLLRDGAGRKRAIDDFFQKRQRRSAAQHRGAGRKLQQPLHAARVVRLGMVDDDIIQRSRVAHLADIGKELLKERLLARLEQHRFFSALHDIGIVGSTVV